MPVSKPELSIYDVAVLGGGLAGLTLARQLLLARPQTKVLVLEKREHPVPEAAFKVGESSVEVGSHYLERMLGLGDHIRQCQLPKYGLRFFFNSPGYGHIAEGLEVGLSETFEKRSYHLDRGRLENFLAGEADATGFTFLDKAKVTDILLDQGAGPHRVTYLHRGQVREVACRWVVDAGGRAGLLRRKLGLGEEVAHKVNAVWFRIDAPLRVDDWRPWPEQERKPECGLPHWLSTIHLMGPGYWVWLIPLCSDRTSVGIVADPRLHPLSSLNRFDRALAWLARHEPQCAEKLNARRDKLMDFVAMRNFSHGCTRVFSERRWALTGEAAVFSDPFYSPGNDFIAIGNSFIAAMVVRDLAGKPFGALANIFDKLFLSFFRNTMAVYQDQYPMFGNPRVMPVKVVWDYAVYWSFLAFVFIQGRMTQPGTYAGIQEILERIAALNGRMQGFFREWHGLRQGPIRGRFIDQPKLALLRHLNEGLTADLDEAGFRRRLHDNLGVLEALHAEIVGHAAVSHPGLLGFLSDAEKREPRSYLAEVFEVLEV